MKSYELIEHTADIRIKIKGRDLKALFRNAGLAIFQISAERKSKKAEKYKEISIKQKAQTLEELFINWLNELLSLSAVKGLIFEDLKIIEIDTSNLKAIAFGRDIKDYKVNTEIKAATYHKLSIKKTASGRQAEVILDV